MTTSAHTSAIERVARVLAGQRLSENAHGAQSSAAPDVDDAWPEFKEDAIAVLKTLREADEAMSRVGDPDTWQRMVRAALGELPGDDGNGVAFDPPPAGTDPMHEGP